MSSQFAQDLRLARKKAGFTQCDLAHLLDIHQTVVSALEHGKRRPTLTEIVTLSLIYGRSFESLFDEVMTEAREHLSKRLGSLPPPGREAMSTFNRPSSIARLRRRLVEVQGHGRA